MFVGRSALTVSLEYQKQVKEEEEGKYVLQMTLLQIPTVYRYWIYDRDLRLDIPFFVTYVLENSSGFAAWIISKSIVDTIVYC
jgi:hypothetical protein